MAWDSSRKVPWRRLVREWLVYAAVATAAFVIYYEVQDKPLKIGLFAGLLSSGPMYVLFGSVLAKFGYQRKTMKELRAERPLASATSRSSNSGSSVSGTAAGRARPAPTKRTSTGPSQRPKNSKAKRR